MLEIKKLYKKYKRNNFYSLKDINIKLEKGEIVGLIGGNGAGKSTIIKSLVGFLKIDEGQVLVGGFDISKEPIKAKQIIGYVPDNRATFEKMTGIEYINFMADIYNISSKDRLETLNMLNEYFNLKDRLNSLISSYSHGMKQKLVLISAFVHEPKLLILDEPFVGLDPTATYQVKMIMKEFCEQGGAIFFSTHILEVAEKLCNKIAIIKQGKIVASGTMEEVTKDNGLEDVFLELTNHA